MRAIFTVYFSIGPHVRVFHKIFRDLNCPLSFKSEALNSSSEGLVLGLSLTTGDFLVKLMGRRRDPKLSVLFIVSFIQRELLQSPDWKGTSLASRILRVSVVARARSLTIQSVDFQFTPLFPLNSLTPTLCRVRHP